MSNTLRMSPKIAKQLHDALAVVVLSDASREWLEANDPMAFKQALDALTDADPLFGQQLDEARQNLATRREEYRLKMGGYFVEVDGQPWCAAPHNLFREVCLAGGHPTCTYRDRAEAEAHVALIKQVAPEVKALVRPGACTRRED